MRPLIKFRSAYLRHTNYKGACLFSTWGSSLGGVINIITKDTGDTKKPSGTLSASYGESNSQDNAGVSGKAGELGYYLFAGRQSSDGLLGGLNRYFDKNSFYSKLNVALSKDVTLGFSAGYNDADMAAGDKLSGDVNEKNRIQDIFFTTSLKVSLTKKLKLEISFYTFTQKFVLDATALGTGLYNNPRTMSSPLVTLFIKIKVQMNPPGAASNLYGRLAIIP